MRVEGLKGQRHEAIAFADIVYQLTRNFPAEERFGLTNHSTLNQCLSSLSLGVGTTESTMGVEGAEKPCMLLCILIKYLRDVNAITFLESMQRFSPNIQ